MPFVPHQAGDAVKAGQPLMILEAMKMEHVMKAGRDGKVALVHAVEGAIVSDGAVLAELEAVAKPALKK